MQMLKVGSQTSPLPIHVQHKAAIYCLGSAHLRGKHRADLLQGSVCWLEVIHIEMALDFISIISDIRLLLSPLESPSPTGQSPRNLRAQLISVFSSVSSKQNHS